MRISDWSSDVCSSDLAWRLYRDRAHRPLVWSADNDTAGMLTADTINVLRNHPLTGGILPHKPGAKRVVVVGSRSDWNGSMRDKGEPSNAIADPGSTEESQSGTDDVHVSGPRGGR